MLRQTYRVVLPDSTTGTKPDRKPSEKSHVESAGIKPRGHERVKTSDTKDRVRKYQETLAEGLAKAVETGDFELADVYEWSLRRLLK